MRSRTHSNRLPLTPVRPMCDSWFYGAFAPFVWRALQADSSRTHSERRSISGHRGSRANQLFTGAGSEAECGSAILVAVGGCSSKFAMNIMELH